MGDQLNVDTGLLSSLGQDLRGVATEFDCADANADWIAGATGHDRLADRIRNFSRDWDDRRADLLAGVAALADAASGTADSLDGVDTELGDTLRGAM